MNTNGHREKTEQASMMEMRLLIRKCVATLAIVVLALLAGSGVTRAQNDEWLDKATNSTPKGSKLSQANGLKDEIARTLRAYYDAWTRLDATRRIRGHRIFPDKGPGRRGVNIGANLISKG